MLRKLLMEKVTYPGQRNDVNKTFVFHFSPPKAVEENKWHNIKTFLQLYSSLVLDKLSESPGCFFIDNGTKKFICYSLPK